MVEKLLEIIESFGAWGVVAICVVIIGVLIYSIIKVTKGSQDSSRLKKQLAFNSKSITDLIKKLIEEHGIQNKVVLSKFEKVEQKLDDIEKRIIEEGADKKILVKDMERVVNKVYDIATEVEKLVAVKDK